MKVIFTAADFLMCSSIIGLTASMSMVATTIHSEGCEHVELQIY